ncbi:hypothetical protein FQN54_009750 [Arachnomyces sp. PD_36]|nr:hypothetical protein FQN54_009750 [Arachnomyces sp. PD_36]
MSFAGRYRIVRRTVGSATVPPEQPNTEEYTYVASALDIGLSLISTEPVKRAMASVARTFDSGLPSQERIFQGKPNQEIHDRVNVFIGILHQAMPIIVIDGNLSGSRIPAYHPRGEWSGVFNPSGQVVNINRTLVDDMVNSANTPGAFRRFQFQFANIFLHEIGAHLLFTYLYHGRPTTPYNAMPANWHNQVQPGQSAEAPAGESGRLLEFRAFDGTLEFFGTPQPSTPWVVDNQNQARKVTTGAIDAAVIQRNFVLPYATTGPARNVASLVANEGRQGISVAMGHQERQFIARAREQPIRFLISRVNLRQVPGNPNILAQPVQA